jgi:hypothetical protein
MAVRHPTAGAPLAVGPLFLPQPRSSRHAPHTFHNTTTPQHHGGPMTLTKGKSRTSACFSAARPMPLSAQLLPSWKPQYLGREDGGGAVVAQRWWLG